MNKRSKVRCKMRGSTDAGKQKSQSGKSIEDGMGVIAHFFKEPHNSRGLHPPFTWDNLDAQVQEMEDLERYGHLGCERAGLRK